MQVSKRFFPEITLDNDDVYINLLAGAIESIDEYASLEVTKTPESCHFRIAPSTSRYLEMLLQEILKLNNLFGIKLDLSKSIKTSGAVIFSIENTN